jgi:hypothetical protein
MQLLGHFVGAGHWRHDNDTFPHGGQLGGPACIEQVLQSWEGRIATAQVIPQFSSREQQMVGGNEPAQVRDWPVADALQTLSLLRAVLSQLEHPPSVICLESDELRDGDAVDEHLLTGVE